MNRCAGSSSSGREREVEMELMLSTPLKYRIRMIARLIRNWTARNKTALSNLACSHLIICAESRRAKTWFVFFLHQFYLYIKIPFSRILIPTSVSLGIPISSHCAQSNMFLCNCSTVRLCDVESIRRLGNRKIRQLNCNFDLSSRIDRRCPEFRIKSLAE